MALSFDGNGQFLERSSVSFINGIGGLTISVWIKSNTTGIDKGICFGDTPDGNDDVLGIRYDSDGYESGNTNTIKCSIDVDNTVYSLECNSNVQTTNWQHLVLRYISGQQIQCFADSVDISDTTNGNGIPSGNVTNTNRLLIGVSTKGSLDSDGWNGLIDDFRIYNRGISDNEIKTVYRLNGRDNIKYGLILHYLFDEDSKGQDYSISENIDYSGNGKVIDNISTDPPTLADSYSRSKKKIFIN